MGDPKGDEPDTLSEAGKRKVSAPLDDTRPTTAEAPAAGTLRIERPRRRRKKNESAVENESNAEEKKEAAADPLADTLDPVKRSSVQSEPPLALANKSDSQPSPPSSQLPLSERIPLVDPASWDRYEIIGLLGKGGMGAVFEARDKRIDRRVAIKFIHSDDQLMTSRFLQEARAQARIDHPNVCKVLEVGEVEGRSYIAMQLIRGKSLSDAAASMSLDDKVRLMKKVTEAVAAAHRLGVIHRDIKPGNIMVEQIAGPDGSILANPVLMDFGLAREESSTQGLTESGALLGTPGYMSPEQARGQSRGTDARTDVYSLGATLYDLLTGAPPFVDANPLNVVLKVLIEDPIPLRTKDPTIPQALETIVSKCLHKEPHQRYASADELAEDLERFLSREKVLARRLTLPERLYWRGRRNKPMAAAVLALVFSLIAFAAYGVRTAIVDARNEAIAQKRAELRQKLGQAVKDLDWLVRSAHLVPLHDTTADKSVVRARMAGIEAEMRSFGDLGAGLDHYAIGRGHLALEEWQEARIHLEKAQARGVRDPELDYALGRVFGELYSRALEDARKSGDATYFEKRKQELDREFLAPALAHLERCRGLPTVSANFLEGLIHFYHRRYDEALRYAGIARRDSPWLYEAAKLEGDVFLARALEAKDRGDNEKAETDFGRAVVHYEQAADIGRSAHQIYEALAEAWIRQEELDLFRGRDPQPKLDKALLAAENALTCAPRESSGHTKKAFAHYFQAQYAQAHGAPAEEVERRYRAQIAAGKQAIALHPNDAYAHEVVGIAYTKLAEPLLESGQPVQHLLDQAYGHLEEAIRVHPTFPWAYNDYGLALGVSGASIRQRNGDARNSLQRAIDTTKKAIELDSGYLIAYNNTSIWLTELGLWEADHGINPEKSLAEAVEMAKRVLRINGKHPLAHGNAGLAQSKIAAYRLDIAEDGREPAKQAVESFQELLAIDPNFVMAQRELARALHILASHERLQGVDPQSSVNAGLRALETCYRLEPNSPECKIVEAELRARQAEWARQQKQPYSSLFEQAEKLALEATQKLPNRADIFLDYAQVCLLRADALRTSTEHAPDGGPVIEEGLRAISRALQLAPGLPRAVAIEGALLFQQAHLDESKRKSLLERAQASLSRAIEANSHLKRHYGPVAAEAERLIKAR